MATEIIPLDLIQCFAFKHFTVSYISVFLTFFSAYLRIRISYYYDDDDDDDDDGDDDDDVE